MSSDQHNRIYHHLRRKPTEEELAQASTPRARRAIETWYQRLNELIEYKERHGHCNVPIRYADPKLAGVSFIVMEIGN